MLTDTKALELFQRLTLSELPIGLYLIARDGRFLVCNRHCRKILAVPAEGPPPASIMDFHHDPKERQRLLYLSEQTDRHGGFYASGPQHLCVTGNDIFVREFIRAVRDPDTGEVVGFVGAMIDITQEHRFRQLIEHLPIGIYRVDAEDRIVTVNEAVVKIMGYRSKSEIENHLVREFYAHPEESDELTASVKRQGSAKNQIKELVKRGGDFIFASLSSVAVTGADGSYEGREGSIIDVTQEVRYHQSMQDVPVGFYEIRIDDGKDIIRRCNQQFAFMHDFESEEQMISLDIKQFHASAEEYHRFLNELHANDALGFPTLGYAVNVKTSKGLERVFEVNSRTLKDRNGRITGRTGVIRDITNERRLREDISSLQSDIGHVLHAYTATLLTAKHSIAATIASLQPQPFTGDKAPSPEEIDAALIGPANQLAKAIDKFTKQLENDWQQRGILPEHWETIGRVADQLRTYRETVPLSEFRPPTLRLVARRLLEVFHLIAVDKLPKESARQIIQDAERLEHLVCLASLRQVEASIVMMDHQVRALRDFVLAGARPKESLRLLRLWDLVKQAMNNLDEFAHSKGVDFKPKDDSQNAHVLVSERDVLRALSNLLHNAIKYSWSREKGKAPWVTIHTFVDGNRAHVLFENYGVPIHEDEIKNRLIFQFGYRGSSSTDRGRLGTGIGLTDALNTAKHHGGNITVESACAWKDVPANDYSAPFITKVTFSLPIDSRKGD